MAAAPVYLPPMPAAGLASSSSSAGSSNWDETLPHTRETKERESAFAELEKAPTEERRYLYQKGAHGINSRLKNRALLSSLDDDDDDSLIVVDATALSLSSIQVRPNGFFVLLVFRVSPWSRSFIAPAQPCFLLGSRTTRRRSKSCSKLANFSARKCPKSPSFRALRVLLPRISRRPTCSSR
jgi:hypothetical protein